MNLRQSNQTKLSLVSADFDPKSLIFDARHRMDVLVSDAFLIGMFTLLTLFGQKMGGFGEVVKYYGIPYLAVNHWLVMITYLQHTDPSLPHYDATEWNFVRGALCTMDRNLLGPVGPYLMVSPALPFLLL